MNDWSGELDKLINDNNNYNYNYNYNKCTICWSFLELPVSCCGKCCVSKLQRGAGTQSRICSETPDNWRELNQIKIIIIIIYIVPKS